MLEMKLSEREESKREWEVWQCLCGNEEVLAVQPECARRFLRVPADAPNAERFECAADERLVTVHCGRVEVPVAHLKRCLQRALNLFLSLINDSHRRITWSYCLFENAVKITWFKVSEFKLLDSKFQTLIILYTNIFYFNSYTVSSKLVQNKFTHWNEVGAKANLWNGGAGGSMH